MAATKKQVIVQGKLDRLCEDTDLSKLAEQMASWEKYAPYCGLSQAEEWEIKHDNPYQYVVQKRRMLERWKGKSGVSATYRNLVGMFERGDDQMLANYVYKLAQENKQTEPNNRKRKQVISFALIALMVLVALIVSILIISHQPEKEKYSMTNYKHYVDKVKDRYKKHLPGVAQSFWLPTRMDTFIQLSLTSRDEPSVRRVDQDSANPRIVSERSKSFDNLLSEIDASPGSRIVVVGQPGIGKTSLLQMITRYWANGKALSSCWILLHIVLRDLVLLQQSPDLRTFVSFMGKITLPPDIEAFILDSDGKGLCFIADGLDEYPPGYEDKTNFIFSELIGEKKSDIRLPQSTVVISSRPEVASQVWHLFEKRVEVLGFGDDQINKYINEKYGEDNSFSKYMDDHPHIKHACYIPLHLAMLVYLKDSLPDTTTLPETETEIYEQFIIHTLIRDFCKDPTSSCSPKSTLPTSLSNVDELNSSEIVSLLYHIANLSYSGIQRRRSIFEENEVVSVLQHTNSSLLVVDKISVLQPITYSFPHLTIQEFLAAFYFNTNMTQQEQSRVLVEYSNQPIRHVFWKFCCGLKRTENQITFLEFFILLYRYNFVSRLPFYCAHEAQSIIASQQLISFTEGIAQLNGSFSYYDAASLAFVAVSAAENLLEITAYQCGEYAQLFLHKLCNATTIYSRLKKVQLLMISPSNIGCLLQKSPNLESLSVTGLNWDKLQSEHATALFLPSYGPTLLNVTDIHLRYINIGDEGIKNLSQLLQHSISLQTLSLNSNGIGDDGASAIADLMKALPLLQHVYLVDNHIGGNGAAMLWNQSIHECCNVNLDGNIIGDDRLDIFISALVGTIDSIYEGNKSCQLEVHMSRNRLLCSDRRYVLTISRKLPKSVMLLIGEDCLELIDKILNRFVYYVGEDHPSYKIGLQWISYIACTIYIFLSTRIPLSGVLYLFCCLTLYILSSFNYVVQVDHFIFTLSFLWSWIVVGRAIVCASLKLLFKTWGWVLIIAVMVQLYFIDFKLIDYQLFAFLYFLLNLGYVLFDLGLFPLWHYLSICCSKFYSRLKSYVG